MVLWSNPFFIAADGGGLKSDKGDIQVPLPRLQPTAMRAAFNTAPAMPHASSDIVSESLAARSRALVGALRRGGDARSGAAAAAAAAAAHRAPLHTPIHIRIRDLPQTNPRTRHSAQIAVIIPRPRHEQWPYVLCANQSANRSVPRALVRLTLCASAGIFDTIGPAAAHRSHSW